MNGIQLLKSNRNMKKSKEEWDDPIVFDDINLPSFNTNIFPTWLKEYVEAVAEFTQTPIDAPAMACISTLSTILSHKYEVNVVGSWFEPLNTYSVLALGPANRKSAVADLISYPVANFESEQLNMVEKEIKNKQITRQSRLLTTDATPESLGELMYQNQEKISILTSEGAEVFEMMTGRYSNKTNIDIYLKAFSGDYIAIDRMGRESVILKKPLMTIGLFVQPSVIKGIPIQFQNRGLTQRFLFSLPTSLIGNRKVQPEEIKNEVKNRYSLNMENLLVLSPNTKRLTFSKEARLLEIKLREEIEEMLGDQELSESFQGWLGKLAGQIIRIAGLLHISKHVSKKNKDIPKEIDSETLKKANQLREYFIEHAKVAHGIMGANENDEDAKYVLDKIKSENKEAIGVRDLLRKTRRIKTSNELRTILSKLEEMGYLIFAKEGRKEVIKINPKILTTDIM